MSDRKYFIVIIALLMSCLLGTHALRNAQARVRDLPHWYTDVEIPAGQYDNVRPLHSIANSERSEQGIRLDL